MNLEPLFGFQLPDYLHNLSLGIGAIILGFLLKYLITKGFKFFARYWATVQLNAVIKHLTVPIGALLPLLLLNLSLNYMVLGANTKAQLNKILEISITINFAFILIGCLKVLQDIVTDKYSYNKEDNLKERKIRTQLQFVRRFVEVLIVLVTIAIVLLSFENMKKIGTGLLTGVGIGGIIIGFAAQKSLGNLLAGFQIAFTQPIRIDDVVIVEGEWGRIEEITLTYVVVSLWDQRRLILPITYFIEKPFQNWTRVSSQLLGTVFLYLDYTAPIQPLRDQLTRLLTNNPLWDKRVNVVQVTDNKESTIEVRLLMSAKSSSHAFDLRCYVREQMITFINENYPESLPKTRFELGNENKTPLMNH